MTFDSVMLITEQYGAIQEALFVGAGCCLNTFTAIVDLSRSNFSIARAPLFQLKSAT